MWFRLGWVCLLGTAIAFSPSHQQKDVSLTRLQAVDVVLFGVGDLRVDDHPGLEKALQSGNQVLPLFVLQDDMLSNIPQIVSQTKDTASILYHALEDLDVSLKQLGLSIHVIDAGNQDILETISTSLATSEDINLHVCDLGDADNALAYGPYPYITSASKRKGMQVLEWNQNLRPAPWKDVETIPRLYPEYVQKYAASVTPLPPTSIDIPTSSTVYSFPRGTIPQPRELTQRFVQILHLKDEKLLDAEVNTGLFATHWGGLPSVSVGCSQALQVLESYVNDCQENDEKWVRHPDFILSQVQRNELSLEHASMQWQLQGTDKVDQWMAGESMTRFLAAPLLFGTISPRRIWSSSNYQGTFFDSPLKRVVEGREWHRLLAAHHMRTDEAYQEAGLTKYRYWRYHGYLCRYAVTDFDVPVSTNKEGLLLVHGFGASGAQWNKAMHEFKQQGTSLVQGLAPDLIGFGEAEKPPISYTGYLWDSYAMAFVKNIALAKEGWSSFVTGGNSIGGFTSMSLAACDTATVDGREMTSSGAPGSNGCTGLVLMNSAGPILSREEVDATKVSTSNVSQPRTVAQLTGSGALPPCSPPPRPVARTFGNGLLLYLRPRIQSICKNLYPTNPSAVDKALCDSIYRDSLDPGAVNVMMAGAKLPPPRTANELLNADFSSARGSSGTLRETSFDGPVLIAQGVLDPLNDARDRMERFAALREGIAKAPLEAGHCPHDELPTDVAVSIASWIQATKASQYSKTSTKAVSI